MTTLTESTAAMSIREAMEFAHMWVVGSKTLALLNEEGFTTVGDLVSKDPTTVRGIGPATAERLDQLVQGAVEHRRNVLRFESGETDEDAFTAVDREFFWGEIVARNEQLSRAAGLAARCLYFGHALYERFGLEPVYLYPPELIEKAKPELEASGFLAAFEKYTRSMAGVRIEDS